MSGWLPALRIARREAARAKGRSLLVMGLIGLPVALLAFAAVSSDTFTLTAEEELARRIGTADARLQWISTAAGQQSPDGQAWADYSSGETPDWPRGEAEIRALLPEGTRLVPTGLANVSVRTPHGIGSAEGRFDAASDSLLLGLVSIAAGRAPVSVDEVAVNAAAARWLEIEIGDPVRVPGLEAEHEFTVTGIVEYPSNLNPILLFAPPVQDVLGLGPSYTWLADTPEPIGWAAVQQLNQHGILVASRDVILNPSPANRFGSPGESVQSLSRGVLIAGLAALEIVLLAGPAFAVGARRRSRDLALVAAAGGEPKQLRRIVLSDGVVLGAAGAIAGLLLGVLAAIAGIPLMEEHYAHRRAGVPGFYPTALLAIAGLAVGTGILAALVPAFTAARQPVVAALTGLRGVVRSRKRWVIAGLALTAAGIAAASWGALRLDATIMLAGTVLAELGLVLVTPALIGLLSRLGRWLPLASRMALRDTARNRMSAAPAVSAVMAAVAGAVMIGVFFDGKAAQEATRHQPFLPIGHFQIWAPLPDGAPDWDELVARVQGVIPDADLYPFRSPACPSGDLPAGACALQPIVPEPNRCPYDLHKDAARAELDAARQDERCDNPGGIRSGAIVDDGAALAAFTGADPASLAEARAVLARGGAVVTDRSLVSAGKVALGIQSGPVESDPGTMPDLDTMQTTTVEGYLLESVASERTFVSSDAVTEAGLAIRTEGAVVSLDRLPTRAEQEGVRKLMEELSMEHSGSYHVLFELGPQNEPDNLLLLLAAVAGAIAIGAAGIATALTAADSRTDLSTLAAAGASPWLRRRLSLSHAGIISGLGAFLGTLAGLAAGAVLVLAENQIDATYLPPDTPPMPFGVPWNTVAVILAVPLIAMAGAGLLTRSRLPIERRL